MPIRLPRTKSRLANTAAAARHPWLNNHFHTIRKKEHRLNHLLIAHSNNVIHVLL